MILVAGEALVDLAVRSDCSVEAHLGGGPFNSARALGRLGVPVGFLGRLSTDAFGRRARAALVEDGVDLGCVVGTDDPTTLALAELDERGTATYRFYTDGTSVPGLTVDEALARLPATVDAVHVGTLGLVLEPLATASEAVVRRLGGDALVLVDPNVRPAVLRDPEAYRARLARIVALADVVKVSDEDLAWLAPGATPEAAAQALLAAGARTVFVTLGGEGALVIGPGFSERVAAPSVVVADTIGAGDAFAGGLLAWWHEHGHPDLATPTAARDAAAFACAVAAATVARPGADPPRRAELPGG